MVEQIVFIGTHDATTDRQIQRAAVAGKLRKIHAGIYTDNLTDPIEEVAIRNVFKIAAHLFGPALLFGRSALNAGPVVEKRDEVRRAWLFLIDPRTNRRRDIDMPGLSLRSAPGPGPIEGDYPHLGLIMPSRARAFLENLIPSRARVGRGPTRTTGADEIERKLERICAQDGEGKLNQIRDQARELASALDLVPEFERLDAIVGALIGTRKAKLTNPTAIARAHGEAYDSDCLARLKILSHHLENIALPDVPDGSISYETKVSAAFIEAYFSNYIEGTRFPVREAGRIIFENERPARRPKDSHDIVSTFNQLVNLSDRLPSSRTPTEFTEELLARHADLMAARPEALPGKWKESANIAGTTTFVLPDYVVGTLKVGVEMLVGLDHPFARAVLVQVLLSDVHPFTDGNGRISRIMMTKELTGSGLSRAVVPTVYRENYLNGLRALTRHGKPDALVRAMTFCQKITAACVAAPIEKAIEVWASTFGFVDEGAYARLEMPDPAREVVWRNEVPAPAEYWVARDNPSLDLDLGGLLQNKRQVGADKPE